MRPASLRVYRCANRRLPAQGVLLELIIHRVSILWAGEFHNLL
jgi:hypothetical protein